MTQYRVRLTVDAAPDVAAVAWQAGRYVHLLRILTVGAAHGFALVQVLALAPVNT